MIVTARALVLTDDGARPYTDALAAFVPPASHAQADFSNPANAYLIGAIL